MFDPRYITTRRVRPIALILRKLGFAAFWPEAGELMGNVQVAMLAGRFIRYFEPLFSPIRPWGEVLECWFPPCPKDATPLRRNAKTRQSHCKGQTKNTNSQ